ncbi:MAG: hypothetical protein FWE27_06595, partial [Defluviitaleaceae bacterium]|nr:hypothetical protein [Defluviitaleaceae bacterium]
MMKLKARKAVTCVLIFLMMFAVVSNSTTVWVSAYLVHTEDAEQFKQLNAGSDSMETFNVAGQLLHLQDLINHANKLLADTLVDVPPGVNTPGNKYWSTQEARDALIAAIAAAQIVLDAHGGGIQPGSLTIIPHSSCFNIPVYEAEIELFINNIRTVHQTETGIISIPNIPVGSSVRFNISTPCDTLYQFPKWEVAEGGIEIPPFAESPEFIMPDSCVFIIAEFETIAEYYFDWNMDLGWDNDSADALIGQFFEWYTDIALDISDSGQPLEWSYNSEIELTKDSVDWVD